MRTLFSIGYFLYGSYLNFFIWETWWYSSLSPLGVRMLLNFLCNWGFKVTIPFSNVLTTVCSFQLHSDSCEPQTRSTNVWLVICAEIWVERKLSAFITPHTVLGSETLNLCRVYILFVFSLIQSPKWLLACKLLSVHISTYLIYSHIEI